MSDELRIDELEADLSEANHELKITKNAAGFCDKHKPDGGSRNCLVCACEKLSHALSRISYLCAAPNDKELSPYDTHFDEDEVVREVAKKLSKLEYGWSETCDGQNR